MQYEKYKQQKPLEKAETMVEFRKTRSSHSNNSSKGSGGGGKKSMDKMELYMNAVEQAAETWKLVQALPDYHHVVGELLFRQIFDIAPMAVSLYKFGQGEPTEAAATATDGSTIPDSLFASPAFKLHAHGVVTMLEAAIGLMLGDDMETLATALQDLGSRHVSYGVHAAHYGIVETALIRTLGGALSPSGHWTDDVRKGWAALFKFVAKAMMSGAGSELQIIKSKRRDSERTKAAKLRLTVIRRSEGIAKLSRSTVTTRSKKPSAPFASPASQNIKKKNIPNNRFHSKLNTARWESGGGISFSQSCCELGYGGDGGNSRSLNLKRRSSVSSSSFDAPRKPVRQGDDRESSPHIIPSIITTPEPRPQYVRANSDLYPFKHDDYCNDDLSLFQDIELKKRPTSPSIKLSSTKRRTSSTSIKAGASEADDTSSQTTHPKSPKRKTSSTTMKEMEDDDMSHDDHLKSPFKRRTSIGIKKPEEDTTSNANFHSNSALQQEEQEQPWPAQQRRHSVDAPPKLPQRSPQRTAVTTAMTAATSSSIHSCALPSKQYGDDRDVIVSVPLLLESYACDGSEADLTTISPVTAGTCSFNSNMSMDDEGGDEQISPKTAYWYWCEAAKVKLPFSPPQRCLSRGNN